MKNPIVSVIVPVYNTEKYLSQCIDSILNQSFKDFELILVNDGSTDESLSICQLAASRDSRLKVIAKENEGVSATRNLGISNAEGDYITFIDSDDLVDSEFLSNLIVHCSDEIDLVQSGLTFFDNVSGNQIGAEILTNEFFDSNTPSDRFGLAAFPLITSPVAKLYRKDIIQEHSIKFNTELSYGEDRDFNLQYIQFVRKAVSISYAGYHYRKGLDGNLSSGRDYIKLLNCDLEYWSKLKDYLQSTPYTEETIDYYLANRLFNFYNDRLLQYYRSSSSFSDLIKTIKTQEESDIFSWLCNHMHLVDSGIIFKTVYKCKSPIALASLLKIAF